MSLTVDDTTYASNAGGITISLDKYLEYYGIRGYQKLALKAFSRLPDRGIKELVSSQGLFYNWISRCEHFKYGCINPCVVIDPKMAIVAAFTSLTAVGEIATPVIKIFKERLDLIKDRKVHVGDRLSSVALYERDRGNPTSPNWKDFLPMVPDCFSDDASACRAALRSISELAWRCLFEGLEQIDDKTRPGLYRIDLPNAMVKAAY
jgi:hypothetical protein